MFSESRWGMRNGNGHTKTAPFRVGNVNDVSSSVSRSAALRHKAYWSLRWRVYAQFEWYRGYMFIPVSKKFFGTVLFFAKPSETHSFILGGKTNEIKLLNSRLCRF